MSKRSIGNQGHLGLLILRVGVGILFILHGYPKMFGGVEKWAAIGEATAYLGIHFLPTLFGFMAALAEFGGGILLILGLFSRTAAFFMLLTMAVATITHLAKAESYYHALTNAIIFLSLTLIGGGRFSLENLLGKK